MLRAISPGTPSYGCHGRLGVIKVSTLGDSLAGLPTLDGPAQDLADERAVLDARSVGDEAKVAVVGRQPRQRVHLDDIDLPVRCEPQIDARDVPAPERHEG